MKIKITNAVIHGGKIFPKDSVHDVDGKTATLLIEGEFAIEQKESEAGAKFREELIAKYGKCSAKELAEVKAGAEKVLAAEPDRADAKTVLEVVAELAKKAK